MILQKNLLLDFMSLILFLLNLLEKPNCRLWFLGLNYKVSENLSLYTEVEKHIDHDFFVKAGIEFDFMDKFSIFGGFRNDLERFSDYSLGFKYAISTNIDLNICSQYNSTLGLSPSIGVSYIMK